MGLEVNFPFRNKAATTTANRNTLQVDVNFERVCCVSKFTKQMSWSIVGLYYPEG